MAHLNPTTAVVLAGILLSGLFKPAGVPRALAQSSTNVRWADRFPGKDCGAKTNAADRDLGATGGEIRITNACGDRISTTIRLSSNHTLRIESGTYNCTADGPAIVLSGVVNAAVIGEAATLTLGDACKFGVKLGGNGNSKLLIRGLGIIGDGVAADAQTGVGTDVGSAVDGNDISIERNEISGTARGIYLETSAANRKNWSAVHITGNYVHHIVGTSSGQGYGIVVSNVRGEVSGNNLEANQRHSIYVSGAAGPAFNGVTVSKNTVRDHRKGVCNGSLLAAIAISRVYDTQVVGNILQNGCGPGIMVDSDTHIQVHGIVIANNSSYNAGGDTGSVDFLIGSQSPSESPLDTIVVRDNICVRSKAANNQPCFRHDSGKNVTYSGNRVSTNEPYSASFAPFLINAIGEGPATAKYTDQVEFTNNSASVTGEPAGNAHMFELNVAACASSARITFSGNHAYVSGNAFRVDATRVNLNLSVTDANTTGLKH